MQSRKRAASVSYSLGDGFKGKRRRGASVPRGGISTAGPRRMAPMASRGFYGANDRLKRAMQGLEEKKVVDTAAGTYVCDTTGTVTAINLSAQGTDFTNRIGRKTTNVAVQLEGQIQPIDFGTTSCKCRVMLIYDAQPNGALPAITDILTASTSQAFMNLNNRDRFKVLSEHNVTIGGISNTATQSYSIAPGVSNVSIYKRCNLDTIWTGTTAAIGSIGTGSLLLVTIGDAAANNGGVFYGAARVRFVDA